MFDDAHFNRLLEGYGQAHQKFMYAVFVSITAAISVAVIPLGLFVPVEFQFRIYIGLAFFGISWLIFAYFRKMYELYQPVKKYQLRIQSYSNQQKASTIIRQEPTYHS